MLQVDPRQRLRLVEIVDNLRARIDDAQKRGWPGEAHGLGTSLEAAEAKLASLDRRGHTDLGFPSMRRRDWRTGLWYWWSRVFKCRQLSFRRARW
ncbi:hypothetical protein ABZ917_48190 [Nonomuraea wenchangensis]